MDTRILLCHNCHKHAPFSEMRYDKTGSKLVCAACRGDTKPTTSKPVIKKKEFNPLDRAVSKDTGSLNKPTRSALEKATVLKFQCPRCRYSFHRSTTHPVTKCPNCGEKKLIRFSKVSADDVLAMTKDDRFDGL